MERERLKVGRKKKNFKSERDRAADAVAFYMNFK